jgi:hypothetical protein
MEISPELLIFAERLKNFLKSNRERGSITPDNPISSIGICQAAAKDKDEKGKPKILLTREDVYHLVHLLRERNEPIASCQKGYYYAISPEELNGAIAEQIKIIKERQETLTLLKKIQANLFKATNSVFDSSVGIILKNELDLIPQIKEDDGGNTTEEETYDRGGN